MNTTDDQKPIIQEASPNSGPPINPDQEEKYKKILDEYTNQIEPEQNLPSQTVDDHSSSQNQTQSFQSSPASIDNQEVLPQETSNYEAPPSYQTDQQASFQSEPIPEAQPTPEPQAQSQFSHQLPPQDLVSTDITPSAQISQEAPLVDQEEAPKPPQKSNFFKYLFILTTIVFIVIVALLVRDYLKLQQLSQDQTPTPQLEVDQTQQPTSIPTDQQCLVNDNYIPLGQSFSAEDGCNTCDCQLVEGLPQIVCTTDDCQGLDTDEQSQDQPQAQPEAEVDVETDDQNSQ